jgi:hypothetical protein
VTADDIHAFGASPMSATPPVRRRWWPWVLGATVLALLLFLAVAASLVGGVVEGLHDGVQVTVDGEPWPLDFHGGAAGLLGVTLAVFITLLVVPLVLLVAGLALVLGLVVAGGAVLAILCAALCAVLLAVLLVTSPLWLLGLLLWLVLKPGRGANPAQ